MAEDARSPWTWRLDPAGGGGALADIGSHILATARYLVGPISELIAEVATPVGARPSSAGAVETRPVEVDDVARLMVRFANGATGSVEASWIATGRKMQHDFEIYGSKGALVFSQERFNELGVYFADDKTGTRGFRTVFAGPDHEPYGAFCVAPGHQIGFNDLKAIEVRDFLRAVAGEASPGPGFAEGYEIQRLVRTGLPVGPRASMAARRLTPRKQRRRERGRTRNMASVAGEVALLEARNISKYFGAVTALHGRELPRRPRRSIWALSVTTARASRH